jgi:hypothetical protein
VIDTVGGQPRAKVIARIADHLIAQQPGRPLRVAVDGFTAAGKTTLAAKLVTTILARGRSAVHLSMDHFHNPRVHRYRHGSGLRHRLLPGRLQLRRLRPLSRRLRLYLDDVDPLERAGIVVRNDDVANPTLARVGDTEHTTAQFVLLRHSAAGRRSNLELWTAT